MSDDDTTDDVEWIANSPLAWGRADMLLNAFQNLCHHLHRDTLRERDTLEVNLIKVRGFDSVDPMAVHADEVLDVKEIEPDTNALINIAEHLSEAELAADSLLADEL